MGPGRLAVLETWPHYRGRLQCFSAMLMLVGAKEAGCFRETALHYRGRLQCVNVGLLGDREAGCFTEAALDELHCKIITHCTLDQLIVLSPVYHALTYSNVCSFFSGIASFVGMNTRDGH